MMGAFTDYPWLEVAWADGFLLSEMAVQGMLARRPFDCLLLAVFLAVLCLMGRMDDRPDALGES